LRGILLSKYLRTGVVKNKMIFSYPHLKGRVILRNGNITVYGDKNKKYMKELIQIAEHWKYIFESDMKLIDCLSPEAQEIVNQVEIVEGEITKQIKSQIDAEKYNTEHITEAAEYIWETKLLESEE
jgi:hypothetical protein